MDGVDVARRHWKVERFNGKIGCVRMTGTYPQASESRPQTSSSMPYPSSREHLSGELRRLDALLSLQVLRFRDANACRKSDKLGALYVADEEVDALLGKEHLRQDDGGSSVKTSGTEELLTRVRDMGAVISGRLEESRKLGTMLPPD